MTWKDKLQKYLDEHVKKLSRNTYLSYSSDLLPFAELADECGDIGMAIDKYLERLEHMKTSTINRKLLSVKLFLQWLGVDGDIMAKLPKPKQAEVRLKDYIPSAEDVSKLLDQASKRSARDELLLRLIVSMGLRPEEITRLNIADVAKDFSSININYKGHTRKVDISSPDVRRCLEEYLGSSVKEEEDVDGRKDKPLFVGRSNDRIGNSTIGQIINAIAREAGVQTSPTKLRRLYMLEVVRNSPNVSEAVRRGVSTNSYYLMKSLTTGSVDMATDYNEGAWHDTEQGRQDIELDDMEPDDVELNAENR